MDRLTLLISFLIIQFKRVAEMIEAIMMPKMKPCLEFFNMTLFFKFHISL